MADVQGDLHQGKEVGMVSLYTPKTPHPPLKHGQTSPHSPPQVIHFGRGLTALKLLAPPRATPEKYAISSVFGLFGKNCSDWVVAEYGALSRGATTLPLYATLSPEALEYMLTQTGCASVFCVDDDNAKRCLEVDAKGLVNLVVVDRPSTEVLKLAKTKGMSVYTLEEVMEEGRAFKETSPVARPRPESIFTFCFTSGSTGSPKGALITHQAMVANVSATMLAFNQTKETILVAGEEFYLSYLPLAHQMERLLQAMMVAFGACIGFAPRQPFVDHGRLCCSETDHLRLGASLVEQDLR